MGAHEEPASPFLRCRSSSPAGKRRFRVEWWSWLSKLPSFSALRQQGAWGRLRSLKPLLSPVVWTTIATGRTPLDHHISDFTALDRATGERVPVTSRMRTVKALWNIFSDQGRTAAVIGWWATWPAESIQGTIVSDRLCYHFLFEQGISRGRGHDRPDLSLRSIPGAVAARSQARRPARRSGRGVSRWGGAGVQQAFRIQGRSLAL